MSLRNPKSSPFQQVSSVAKLPFAARTAMTGNAAEISRVQGADDEGKVHLFDRNAGK